MENKKSIMIVDDNMTNLKIGRSALTNQYNVYTVVSGEKLFQMLEKVSPDLILLDVEMPEMDGYEAIRRLKADKKTAAIPVIFLTARNDSISELEGLSLGAVDYIIKPFSPPILLKRVETHLLLKDYNDDLLGMVETKTKTVIELQNVILQATAEIVEYRDDITGNHIERTKRYLQIIVDELIRSGIYRDTTERWNLEFLFQSALLHDVGKIAIKDSILLKPGRLTFDEFEVMKTHTTYGVKIIEKIESSTTERDFLSHAKILAGTHHEHWDGSGYPKGLKGEDIPLQGRLMAIVDVYDALTSERPYKNAFSHEDAVQILTDSSGSHFDPALIQLFLNRADDFEQVKQQMTEAEALYAQDRPQY